MRLPELEVLNALESIDPEVWTRGSRAWLIVRQHATIMFESLLEGGNALLIFVRRLIYRGELYCHRIEVLAPSFRGCEDVFNSFPSQHILHLLEFRPNFRGRGDSGLDVLDLDLGRLDLSLWILDIIGLLDFKSP